MLIERTTSGFIYGSACAHMARSRGTHSSKIFRLTFPPFCRLWHQKLEQEADGMVNAILEDTNHKVTDLATYLAGVLLRTLHAQC